MRNLREYPISKDEIVECLDSLIKELGYERTLLVGDMRPLLLQKAKDIILTGTFEGY